MIRKLREGLTSRIQFHLYNTGNRVTSFKAFVDKCMGTEAAAAHQDVDRARTVYRLREQDFPFPAISPRDRERKRNEGPENLRWASQILFFFFFFFLHGSLHSAPGVGFHSAFIHGLGKKKSKKSKKSLNSLKIRFSFDLRTYQDVLSVHSVSLVSCRRLGIAFLCFFLDFA